MVGADLMACPGAAVDHDCDLAFEQAEPFGYFQVVDLIDPLNLQEMVATA